MSHKQGWDGRKIKLFFKEECQECVERIMEIENHYFVTPNLIID